MELRRQWVLIVCCVALISLSTTALSSGGLAPSQHGYSTTGPWVGNGPWDFYATEEAAVPPGCVYWCNLAWGTAWDGSSFLESRSQPGSVYSTSTWQCGCGSYPPRWVMLWAVGRCGSTVMHAEYGNYATCTWNCPNADEVYSTSGVCVKRSAGKSVGLPLQSESCQGNPCDISSGQKVAVEIDYLASSSPLLAFSRKYSSSAFGKSLNYGSSESLGRGWASSVLQRVDVSNIANTASTAGPAFALSERSDGKLHYFLAGGASWTTDVDVNVLLREIRDASNVRIGWNIVDHFGRTIESYDVTGKLLSITAPNGLSISATYSAGRLAGVTDQFGRSLAFGYDGSGRIVRMTDPAGGEYLYAFDGPTSFVASGQPLGNNLTTVTFPDTTKRIYHYNEQENTGHTNQRNALTGVSTQTASGVTARYATYKYDTQAHTIETQHVANADKYGFTYLTTPSGIVTTATVVDPLSTQRSFTYANLLGVNRLTGVSQPAGAGSASAGRATTYDANANVASRTDFNNNKICYAYDLSRNLETKRVEGVTSSTVCSTALSSPPTGARIISTQWHPDWRLETRIAEPKKLTTIVYNGQGATCAPSTVLVDGKPPAVICTRTEQATTDETGASGFAATVTGIARTWRYTYTTYGRVLTATDPNNRTTTHRYHADDHPDLGKRGNVASITNAANHTTFITDYNPHGQPTRMVDPNGVVTVLTYDPRMRLTSRTVGNEATVFGYDPVGQMTSVNLPDGARLTYTYDAAHRLTAINDHKGNRIDYTLDAMGNRITEKTKDPGGVLVGNIARVIDALNRVERITGAVP